MTQVNMYFWILTLNDHLDLSYMIVPLAFICTSNVAEFSIGLRFNFLYFCVLYWWLWFDSEMIHQTYFSMQSLHNKDKENSRHLVWKKCVLYDVTNNLIEKRI